MKREKVKQKIDNAMSKKEKDMLDLIYKKKTPETPSEKQLAKEIEAAKKAGKTIYIPYD
jgi:hypothetical protein